MDMEQLFAKPRLGVATWIFGDLPLTAVAERLAALAFDGVVLSVDPTHAAAGATRRVLEEAGLEIFALMPANVDLVHADEALRRQAIYHYQDLLEFAEQIGAPRVICRGFRGRTRPYTSLTDELAQLETAVRTLGAMAANKNLQLALDVVNRYESHLLNTAAEAREFLQAIDMPNLGIALNAFHMNIEEQDETAAIRQTGERLMLYTISDSNRRAIGGGHTKLGNHLWALEDCGYAGPIILECLPPHVDPFVPQLDGVALALLQDYLRDSRSWF